MTTENVSEFYGDKELRWYQIAAVNEAIHCIEHGMKRILICLPTGAGKTITVMAALNHPHLRKILNVNGNLRVLFIAHNHRLLSQAERTFISDSGIELILQSTQSSISEDIINQGWDITILDEAHHESVSSYQLKLEDLCNKPMVGLTATDIRADNFLLKFEHTINPISREQAVSEGYLSPTNLYSVITPPTKTKTDIIKDLLSTYHTNMDGTLIFMRTKKEVIDINNHLLSLGLKSIAVINQTKNELDDVLDEFEKGTYQFIVSCNKLGEGVDIKGCSCVVIGRTIGSLVYLNQLIGRAARPDCECHVYELINPLSKDNLDTTVITGTPNSHKLIFHRQGQFQEMMFDYTTRR